MELNILSQVIYYIIYFFKSFTQGALKEKWFNRGYVVARREYRKELIKLKDSYQSSNDILIKVVSDANDRISRNFKDVEDVFERFENVTQERDQEIFGLKRYVHKLKKKHIQNEQNIDKMMQKIGILRGSIDVESNIHSEVDRIKLLWKIY